MTDAITREEKLMEAIATGSPSNIKPITREEMFLAKAGGQDVETPEPITRREKLLQGIIDNGGGGGSKPQGTISITENGTHDVAPFATAEVMVSGGGDIDALIDGSFSGDVSSDVLKVNGYAFWFYEDLTSANFPLATTVGDCAFTGCAALTTADFPLATSIGNRAFQATALTTADFPLAEAVGYRTFSTCSKLKTARFPMATVIGGSSSNTGQAFYQCSSLETVDFPKAGSVGNSAFYQNTSLKDVNLPLVHTLNQSAFHGCSSLEVVDFPSLKLISKQAFHSCTLLDTLILRNETVCTLSDVSAFTGTPFAIGGTGGEAYVPQALIEDYKIATNWSTLYEAGTVTFVAKEGSIYE